MTNKKEELRKLNTGDIISLTDGRTAEFLRLKRTKFLCQIEDQIWDCSVEYFDKLIKKGEPNPLLEKVKKILDKSKNTTIGTIYGPSTVVGLNDDMKHVDLLEMGTELYCLTLEDFINEYEEHNLPV